MSTTPEEQRQQWNKAVLVVCGVVLAIVCVGLLINEVTDESHDDQPTTTTVSTTAPSLTDYEWQFVADVQSELGATIEPATLVKLGRWVARELVVGVGTNRGDNAVTYDLWDTARPALQSGGIDTIYEAKHFVILSSMYFFPR